MTSDTSEDMEKYEKYWTKPEKDQPMAENISNVSIFTVNESEDSIKTNESNDSIITQPEDHGPQNDLQNEPPPRIIPPEENPLVQSGLLKNFNELKLKGKFKRSGTKWKHQHFELTLIG